MKHEIPANGSAEGLFEDAVAHSKMSHHVTGATKRLRRRWFSWITAGFICAGIVLMGAALIGRQHPTTIKGSDSDDPDELAEDNRPAVQTIRPRRDPGVRMQVKQFASVEPFYTADLKARASGVVRAVYKDINDRVVQGELLIDIDVPDLERDVALKKSAVKQRRQELRVAQAKHKDAEAGVEVSQTIVRQRMVEVTIAAGTYDFRRKRLARIVVLADKGSIGPDVVDEWERDTHASEAAVEAARVGVDRAKADLKEAQSKVQAALADIDLKEASVEYAINEMEKTRAVADFARITAPFDGVVTRRNVHPGSFVQNATTGQSETLMSVVRTDLVTVVAKFPDNAAPFIARDTPASIQIDEVPGLSLAGRVTRYSPSIQNSDRTMQVEVDLFNGSAEDFLKMVHTTAAAGLGGLGASDPLGLAVLRAGTQTATEGLRKGPNDDIPCRAAAANSEGLTPNLLPGMSGMLQLELGRFKSSYILPTGAIFSRGGKPYVLIVQEGAVKQTPVKVQMNDGKLAKVSLLVRRTDSTGQSREVSQELTGQEEIIPTRQLEYADGQIVKASLIRWDEGGGSKAN